MKRYLALLPLCLGLAIWLPAQQATIQEEKQVIKTYPFSDPEPVAADPIRREGTGGQAIYPYFSFENETLIGVDQTWNVVRMENPYIRVFILPGEGGKLLGAVEKSTNKQFAYYNHVLKFRDLSMRGPWTSGGVEMNFGIIGHAPSTATPVDYLIRKNSDGSVSCFVGTIDLASRTEWRVEYHLLPDKAYLEARTLWYNPGPLDQSYYVWANSAQHLSQDVEFIFPGTTWIGHDYSKPPASPGRSPGTDAISPYTRIIRRGAAISSMARSRISSACTGTIRISDTVTGRCMATCPARSCFCGRLRAPAASGKAC